MKGELSNFYRGVTSRKPLRNRILVGCIAVAVILFSAGFGLEASRLRPEADWMLIAFIGSLLLACCMTWIGRLGERVRVGQIMLEHRQRGMIELELGPGNTLKGDARRIACLTGEIDEEDWADLELFVRTAVRTEDRLQRLGFATRRSGKLVSWGGCFSYRVKWIGWSLAQATRGRKPPKFVQGKHHVEGEMDLRRCVRRWSGSELPRGSGTPRNS